MLKPTPRANRAILGIFARCTSIYPQVEIYAYVFLSNHYHLIIASEEPEFIPKFMALLNTELAKKVGNKIHHWSSKVFARRYDAAPILDEASLGEKLRYVFMHGGKEGLVQKPKDWPGLHCIESLVEKKKLVGYWTNESKASAKRALHGSSVDISDCESSYELKIAPLPVPNPDAFVSQAYQNALAEIKELRGAKKALGRSKILKQNAHDSPKQARVASPRAWCHTICSQKRRQWRKSYFSFCESMQNATQKLGSMYRRYFVTDNGVGFLPAQI